MPRVDTAARIGSTVEIGSRADEPVDQLTTGEPSSPTGATGVPAAGTSWGHASQRTLAEFARDPGTGLLGAVVAGVYGALLGLSGLITALNNDRPSRGGFLVLALPLVGVAVAATTVLIRRAQAVRAQGLALDAVHALAVGAGVFTSTYGVLRVLTALLSEGSAALTP